MVLFTTALLLTSSHKMSALAQVNSPPPQSGPVQELDPSRPLLSTERPTRTQFPAGKPQQNLSPPAAPETPVFRPLTSKVETGDLAPVIDNESTGLPLGVWQGLDTKTLEKLFAKIDLPPRSPALNALWHRFLTAREDFGQNERNTGLQVLRAEALFRSGHLQDILEIRADQNVSQSTRHMTEFMKARAELGLGDRKAACETLRNAGPAGNGIPKGLALQLLKMTIYCRAQEDDMAGANLVLDLARDQGIETPYAAKAVYGLENKRRSAPTPPKKLDLIDYKFMMLFKRTPSGDLIEQASAPVLSAMLNEQRLPKDAYLRASERALRLNVISPERMAGIYKTTSFSADELNNPFGASARYPNRPEARALLYRAVEFERDPVKRAQLARSLMTSARGSGLYIHIAKLLSGTMERLPQTSALAWFAESAIEISLASGQYEKALNWAVFGSADDAARPRNLLNWLTLIDIGAPEKTVPNGAGLSTTEEAALAGQFSPDTLHRLVTVLDALKYDVPIRLWNLASSAPQPKSGHLPETGILSELQKASANQQYGKVILYSIIALGPDGPEGAHMIALRDTIKALSAIGLKDEARTIGLEALYAVWPRLVSY